MSSFGNRYRSATEIGRSFGISAIALGKALDAAGLRDPVTRQPTPAALGAGFAVSPPLKDGPPHFMWDRHLARRRAGRTVSHKS